MSQTPLIRPVESRDFEHWKVLWDGYNAVYGREGSTALPEANTRMTWSRFFDAYDQVAEHNGAIVYRKVL